MVLDVHTGDVLALASVPSFEPGAFVNGLSRDSWRELTTNINTPLVNKAIGGQYPPGSTFKMIVALAALEAGVTGPDYEVFCPGSVRLGDHQFHCWKRWGHGRLSLVQAIAQSCDVYFYDLARRSGRRCDRRHGAPVRARRRRSGSTCPASAPGWCRTGAGSGRPVACPGSSARR